MPKENINDTTQDAWRFEVSWKADETPGGSPGHVQVVSVNLNSPFSFPADEDGECKGFDGWRVTLDEAGIDRSIAALTKAKRQAFPPTSNLIAHARKELDLLGEDELMKEHLLGIVETFAAGGHSGASAAYAVERLGQLLSYENITPLTDNPDEWEDCRWVSSYPLWQSKRNPAAFSEDGGKTYYLVNEDPRIDRETNAP